MKFIKILEIALNWVALLWLLAFSFLGSPVHIDHPGELLTNINDEYGTSHILTITITLSFSILIVVRLIKKSLLFRVISLLIVIITATFSIIYWNNFDEFGEMIRGLVFGSA